MSSDSRRHAPRVRFRFLTSTLAMLLFGAASGHAATMTDLLAGASLTCGDKTFSNFRGFSSVASGGATAPTAAEVFVNTDPATCGSNIFGQPGPGLLFQSANWNVNAGQSMDTAFTFDITVTNSLLASIGDASMSLLSFATLNGGDIHITESLFNGSTNVGNLVVDPGLGQTTDSLTLPHPGFPKLTVNKDVSLEGHTEGSASLSTFTQNFSEVPELGTLSYFSIGILGVVLGSIRVRRIRNLEKPGHAISAADLKNSGFARERHTV